MQLADLPIPHLTKLKGEEQLALILSVRERRRFVVKATRVAKAAKQQSKKNPLAAMTQEQLERLLEALTTL